jgi:hypothetical protein
MWVHALYGYCYCGEYALHQPYQTLKINENLELPTAKSELQGFVFFGGEYLPFCDLKRNLILA